jgi:hypothetical protein
MHATRAHVEVIVRYASEDLEFESLDEGAGAETAVAQETALAACASVCPSTAASSSRAAARAAIEVAGEAGDAARRSFAPTPSFLTWC